MEYTTYEKIAKEFCAKENIKKYSVTNCNKVHIYMHSIVASEYSKNQVGEMLDTEKRFEKKFWERVNQGLLSD